MNQNRIWFKLSSTTKQGILDQNQKLILFKHITSHKYKRNFGLEFEPKMNLVQIIQQPNIKEPDIILVPFAFQNL